MRTRTTRPSRAATTTRSAAPSTSSSPASTKPVPSPTPLGRTDMASFLYRLGLGAARRPVAVLIAWILVLGSVAAAMASFQRPLTNEFELPDSEFAAVLDDLGEQIPEIAGGTGTVVLHSEDGFTPTQRRAIDATTAEWRRLPHVTGIVDPFETQQQLDRSSADLAAGEQKLLDGT